jgi:hypothetical protein
MASNASQEQPDEHKEHILNSCSSKSPSHSECSDHHGLATELDVAVHDLKHND